jgi:hypothetical protein
MVHRRCDMKWLVTGTWSVSIEVEADDEDAAQEAGIEASQWAPPGIE